MTKKKVTAPLTYNPGKGRPKEHLAYLNYQEMQALKRLNGNNQERGPRGLPSFPPAGAMSGGSAKSPASTSRSAGAGSRPSSGGPRSGVSGSVSPSSGSPRGSNPPSGGGGSNSGSRPSGGMMGGSGSGGSSRTSPSSGGGNKGNTTSVNRSGPGSTGGYKTPGAGGSNADRAAINAANKTNTLSAQKAPAFKADTGRTVNVGPMGTPVKVGAPASRPSIPKATVQSPMAGQGASFASPFDARIENFQRINDQRLKSGALGPEGVPSVSQIAAENARRLNAAKMAQQYSQYRSPPRGYPAAPQGVYGPRVGVGTSYLGTTDMPGMITTGMTSPYSGTINPRFNAAQTLMAYEAEKRVPGKIQDRVPPTERLSTAKTRGIGDLSSDVVPGVSPNERAMMMTRTDVVPGVSPNERAMMGRLGTTPVVSDAGQFPAPADKKQFYDRINVVPSPEQSLYTGRPGKTRGIDVSPTYPDYGPPGGARGLGGYIPSKINGYEVYNPADYENSLALKTPSWKQSPAYSYNPDEEYSTENTAEGVPGSETPATDYTDNADVYGPKYVDPEAQKVMRKQDKRNIAGVRAAKTFTGPIGRVASAADALRKVFTGKSTTEATADLKRAYMQASDEQRAALEKEYPNLTKFASDVGETPQLGMDNYTNWADRSGLRGPPDRRGGGENSGIASLGTGPKADETTTPRPDTPDTPSTSPGRRPDIHYMWDLGINIPSPSDPNYNQYQTYLAERLAAQRAMGYA